MSHYRVLYQKAKSIKRQNIFIGVFNFLNTPVQSSLSEAGSHMLPNLSAEYFNSTYWITNRFFHVSSCSITTTMTCDPTCVTQSVFHLSFSFPKACHIHYTTYQKFATSAYQEKVYSTKVITVVMSFRLIAVVLLKATKVLVERFEQRRKGRKWPKQHSHGSFLEFFSWVFSVLPVLPSNFKS